jgi:hypothetical protein
MRGSILPLPQYVLMACCLVKHRDFTLTYTYIGYITSNGRMITNNNLVKNSRKRSWPIRRYYSIDGLKRRKEQRKT